MKHLPALFIFCSGLLFCCFAIPCHAEILFAFDSGGGTSDMSISGTIPGSSDTVTYLTDVFHTLTIAGLPGDVATTAAVRMVVSGPATACKVVLVVAGATCTFTATCVVEEA